MTSIRVADDCWDADPDELIACTICDALHRVAPIPAGGRLRCVQCGTTLLRADVKALDAILASAAAMAILVISAVFFPFLRISASGFSSSARLTDTARAFAEGLTAPLAVALILVIVVVPVVRAIALFYALLPIRLGRKPVRGARKAFRLACELRPWSMAEIFIVGVAVALVKVGGMATVSFGPAFWELTLVVLIVVLESSSFCEKSLWRIIDQRSKS